MARITHVRIGPKAAETLEFLAHLPGNETKTRQAIAEEALEQARRKAILEDVAEAYKVLRADPAAWTEHQAELAIWDQTLGDGLKGL